MNYCLLASLALIASPALASDWVKVGESDDGSMLVDVTSIRTDGQYRSAWKKFVPVSGKISQFLALELYDCNTRRTALKSFVKYLRDGTNDSSHWSDYELEWRDVTPDTLGEAAFSAVCQ